MTVKRKTFKKDRSNTTYTTILSKGIVTVRVNNNGAQGNNAICGTYDPMRHSWCNSGRKVIPHDIKTEIEEAFKPHNLMISN